MSNAYFEMPSKPICLLLPFNDKGSRDDIDRMLCLYHHNIVVKINPTKRYLLEFAESKETLYNEISETLCKGDVDMRINEKSKFAKMQRKNARYDEVIKRDNIANRCKPDCSICCNDLFFVSENEFLFIVAWLIMKRKKSELAKAYLRGRKQLLFISENYKDKGDDIKRTYSVYDKKFYNIGETVTMLESCPFLDDKGRCVCYEARPNICRKYGTTTKCYNDYYVLCDEYEQEIAINPIYDEILKDNVLLKDGERYFMKQARPLYYFTEKYLSKENIKQTIKLAKEFAAKEENEFANENSNELYEFIYISGEFKPK